MTENVIELEGVRKNYSAGFFIRRKSTALTGINLTVKKGEIFGLLGPNGAGKTTLLNLLIGILKPDGGNIRIMSEDVTGNYPRQIKERMNICSGNPNFAWCMTVTEILRFYGMLYERCTKDLEHSIAKYIDIFELSEYADVKFNELSTGTKQRLAMAKSFLNEPEILLLDEPTIGLDPDIARKTRGLIKDIHARKNTTIILTTHYMKEAEELCDRISFIRNGSIIAAGTNEELKGLTQKVDLEGVFLELAHQ